MWSTFFGVILAVLVVAAAVGVAWFALVWPWRSLVKRDVVVVLDTERTLRGLLVERRGALLVLADCSVLESGQAAPAGGLVHIDRSRVQWIQVIS